MTHNHRPEPPLDPWPLTALRALVIVGAALLLTAPIAARPGMASAALAALGAVVLSRRLSAAPIRWAWIGVAALVVAGVGLLAETLIGGTTLVPRLIGPAPTLKVIEIVLFGALAFGAVIFLRTLSSRFPPFAILEAIAVVGSAAFAFSAHRRYPFSQPQWLSDWAFGSGYDPRHVLVLIGFATLGGLAVLFLPRTNLGRSVAGLGLMGLLVWLLLSWLFGSRVDPRVIAAAAGAESSRQQAIVAGEETETTAAPPVPGQPSPGQPSPGKPGTFEPQKVDGNNSDRKPGSARPKGDEHGKADVNRKKPEPPRPDPPPRQKEHSPPRISIDGRKVVEGNSGTTALEFEVTLSEATELPVQVDFRSANGTAQSEESGGTDYASAIGRLEIPAGERAGKIVVRVNGDTEIEPDETVIMTLTKPVNAILENDRAVGTIVNDDIPPPLPELTIEDSRVNEGNAGDTPATFSVKLSEKSFQDVTVEYVTEPGTATANVDFRPAKGALTIPAGQTEATLTVAVIGDTLSEPDETFTVRLSKPKNATLKRDSGVGTIIDDDKQPPPPPDPPKQPPTISIDDPRVEEGNAGTTPLRFTLTLSEATNQEVRVEYLTLSRTAKVLTDFRDAAGTVVFPPGETRATVTVEIIGDTEVEPDETFSVALVKPVNATIKKGEGIGTIVNDDRDPPLPRISIEDAQVEEGNAGKTPLTFSLKLSEATPREVTVDFATEPGTAAAGEDFVPAQGTVRFPAGQTQASVTIEVGGDVQVEPDETLRVRLSKPVQATLERDAGTGTIINDDKDPPPPKLSVGDAKVLERNSGTTPLEFEVTLSEASSKEVTVHHATGGGSARPGEDYEVVNAVLTIPAGQTRSTVVVQVKGDTDFEPDENFVLQLSAPENATLEKDQGTGTIVNDDEEPPDEPPPDDEFNWELNGPPPLEAVLLAKLHSDFTPVEGGYYFRVRAYSRVVRGRLLRAETLDTDVVWSLPTGVLNVPTLPPTDFQQDLPVTAYLIGAHTSPPALVQPSAFTPHENPAPAEFTAVFDVTSVALANPRRKGDVVDVSTVLADRSAGDPAWDDETRQAYLKLPDDPRYRQLADDIANRLTERQRSSPLARAAAVRKWMEANLTYDYNPAHAAAEDRTASFLFGDRRGYCVHLAHAMAFLLRAQGVPARVAKGYRVATERRGQRGSLLAYTTDEHAWAEIHLEGVGWVVAEAGVKGRIPPPDPQPDPRELDRYLQVIGDLPQELFADDPPAGMPWGTVLAAIATWLGIPAVVCAFYTVKWWRLLLPLIADEKRLPRVGYRAMLDQLAEMGLRRTRDETWDEFADRVRGIAPEFVELTAMHLRHAYGRADPVARGRWRELQQRVSRQVSQTLPAYRLWLGRLNPFSWVGVG